MGRMASTDAEALAQAAARVNLCLGYEARLLAMNAKQRKLPVTIVTGFLGTGKTSLLHHILKNRLNLQIACAVSDLAAINIDALLVKEKDMTFFQLQPSIEKKAQVFNVASRTLDAFKDVVWRALKESETPFDYLIVETSGTTDPTQLVAAVQEKFGKMTHARLDSVVVVVDGDAMAQDAKNNISPCDVAIKQLECADIVILNKIDLMDEHAKKLATSVIRKYAPAARIYETDHGQVYLPHVLDITPPEGVYEAVSHESVKNHWNCATDDNFGSLRTNTSGGRSTNPSSNGGGSGSSAFTPVAYEQLTSTPLAAVHAWLQSSLPATILRAKGVIYLADDPKNRYVVQLSGKKRLEVENTGRWLTTPKTQFVVIGTNFDEEQVLQQLQCSFETTTESLAAHNECMERLTQDERFDVVHVLPLAVQFRLICPATHLDEVMLRHHHHVDMDELTKRLVREVNASGGGSLLTYSTVQTPEKKDVVVAMASIGGTATVLTMWDELDARASAILLEVKKKLVGCLCGF